MSQLFNYLIFGCKLQSDAELKQLVVCEDDREPDLIIKESVIPVEIKVRQNKNIHFEHTGEFSWLKNDTLWLYVQDDRHLYYEMTGGGVPKYLSAYLLGFGMSMLALQRGILAVHCSAIADEKGAVLLAGESGAGKSTVTTAFLNAGYHLLADDMSWVETKDSVSYANPAFPYQKLCRNVAMEQGYELDELIYIDEDKDKFLAPYRGEFKTEKVPVKAFIMLGVTGDEEIVSREVTGFDKLHVCANNLFLRHLLKNDKYKPEIGQMCLNMASSVPIYYVARPGDKDTTKQVIEKCFDFVEMLENK